MFGIDDVGGVGKRVSDATILMHEAIARKMGLNGADHKYLGIIMSAGKLTAGELSKLTGLTTGAVTGLIDRLEKRKLVKRIYDKTDRRKIYVEPNVGNVNAVFSSAHLGLKQEIEALLSTFTNKEIDAIGRYLNATIDIMNGITEKLNAG